MLKTRLAKKIGKRLTEELARRKKITEPEEYESLIEAFVEGVIRVQGKSSPWLDDTLIDKEVKALADEVGQYIN